MFTFFLMPSNHVFHTSAETHSPAARAVEPPAPREELKNLLAPLFEAARDSASLIASHHPVEVRGAAYEIPKFLLLGQRGGGKPIRIGLFSGFDASDVDTIGALTHVLLQLKLSPALTRDFALLAYPLVNVRGFGEDPVPLADFEARFARDSADADVQFFKTQLKQWTFDGLISLRTDAAAKGFYASVRSEIIAREVVEPALAVAASALPLASKAVKVRPGDRYARTADYAHGRLSPPADVRPYPFEIELVGPRARVTEKIEAGLFVAITEILRHYRGLVAHAQNL
jgi:hypothetical protein